jgi:hypothetical protein
VKCLQSERKLIVSDSIDREIEPVCYSKLEQEGKKLDKLIEETVLTTDMGGDVEKLIMETSMKRYECLGLPSGHMEIVGAWYGYPHDGGIPDKDGKKWWAYQKCIQSNYSMSYWKVKNRIEKIQEEQE